MNSKRFFISFLCIFLIILLSSPALAQFRKIHKFKRVQVPFNLKYEGSVFEKGQYDFEIIAHRSIREFQLKVLKRGKTLCIIPGEILRDKPPGARGEEMEGVSDDPTLKMKRIPAKKIVNIIFETGKLTQIYPCFQVQFQMEYE